MTTIKLTREEADFLIGCTLSYDLGRLNHLGYKTLSGDAGELVLLKLQKVRDGEVFGASAKALVEAAEEDPLAKAEKILERLKADEPRMVAEINASLAEMADAREELGLHLAAMKSEERY